MGNFFGPLGGSGGSGGSSGARLGSRLAFASPAGAAVAAAPAGFSSATGRLLVTLSANTTWISLTAGVDGQLLDVIVAAGAFTLILPAADFLGFGDLNLGLGNRALLYYDSTDVAWERTSP